MCSDGTTPSVMTRVRNRPGVRRVTLRKWLRRLPHPFPPRDRAAGYRYALSILQAEFSLTQVLDQPVTGRSSRSVSGRESSPFVGVEFSPVLWLAACLQGHFP